MRQNNLTKTLTIKDKKKNIKKTKEGDKNCDTSKNEEKQLEGYKKMPLKKRTKKREKT